MSIPQLENIPLGTQLAELAIHQILRACVEELIVAGNLPQRLPEPGESLQSALQWLLCNFLPFEPTFYLEALTHQLTQQEQEWYLRLLNKKVSPVIRSSAGINDQVRLLLITLRQAGYEQLWITIDGLEQQTSCQDESSLMLLLNGLFSTLAIFRMSDIAFKFFLPAKMRAMLRLTAAAERLRTEELELRWTTEDLILLLERRLQYAFCDQQFSLKRIYPGEELLNWLKEYGGNLPRDWCLLVRPFVQTYAREGKSLTFEQWRSITRQHPPRFRLDRQRREVWIGKKCIQITSDLDFRLLEYLVDHAGKICTFEELFYHVHQKLDYVPPEGNKPWVHPSQWRGKVDTQLWRVRQKIEPEPKEPLYLVTRPGQGVELCNL